MSGQMNRWPVLSIISVAVLLALSLWFSATTILPQLALEWQLTDSESASMTTAVQIGFIVGALFLTWTQIADRVNGRYLFASCALMGAVSNLLFTFSSSVFVALLLRFLTGAMLAGVYPTSIRLISDWFTSRKGTAVGIIIGALTVGSALPHLVRTFAGELAWQTVMYASSALATVAAVIIFLLPDFSVEKKPRYTITENAFQKVIRNRPVMLANYGYFGHMWELYAMWTWLPVFLVASFQEAAVGEQIVHFSPLLAFFIIGIAGACGAIGGGLLADCIGKARLAKWSMVVSSICALVIGFTYGQSIWLTIVVAIIWGASVIADSAQFSALATEYAQADSIGTALTFQMAGGFLITVVSIYCLPLFVAFVTWQWAFSLLMIGPAIGAYAMHVLIQYEKGTQ